MTGIRNQGSGIRKFLTLVFLTLLTFTRPAAAVEVKQLTSPGGIEIWFVEDHRLPILALSFAFQGGIALDPPGKAGLTHFVSGMLDEGAGPRDSETFQATLADNSIALDFSAGRDSFNGALRTLTSHTDLAAELLHDSLTAPHLNPPDVDRIRDDIEAEIKRNMADPNWVAQRTFNGKVFANHPYGEPGHGSLDSIAAITPDNLKSYVTAHFGRDQLVVTATGDLDGLALGQLVDRIFGDLPAKAAPFTIPEATLHEAGKTIIVEKPIPESILLLGGPGPKRDDADWYAAEIMNYALGGGGFNSRLMEEVRAKRGLTYGVGSSLVPFQHAGLIEISGSTKNEDAGPALQLIDSEIARFASGGITDAELKDAKTYLTGSVPLELTSTLRISGALLSLRLDHLPPTFFDDIAGKLNAVNKTDVARAAQRFLQPAQFTTVVLGQPQGISASP